MSRYPLQCISSARLFTLVFAVMTSITLVALLVVVVAGIIESSAQDTSRNLVYEATGSCQVEMHLYWLYRCTYTCIVKFSFPFFLYRWTKPVLTGMQPNSDILGKTRRKQLALEQWLKFGAIRVRSYYVMIIMRMTGNCAHQESMTERNVVL